MNIISATFSMNSPIMYALYAIIVAFVVFESVYYLVKSIRRAKVLGIENGKIKKVITSSIGFSVLPGLGIALGVTTLVGSLGVAFPAIRLSVIGSLQYETQMADGAATALAGSLQGLINRGMTADDFLTIATIMTVSIMAGPLIVLFFYKWYQPKVAFLGTKSGSADGKTNLGDLIFQVVFIGMVIGYLAMSVADAVGVSSSTPGANYFNFIAVIIAATMMYIFDLLITKANWKWLDNFATPFAMLIAMAVVAVISYFSSENNWVLSVPEVVASIGLI